MKPVVWPCTPFDREARPTIAELLRVRGEPSANRSSVRRALPSPDASLPCRLEDGAGDGVDSVEAAELSTDDNGDEAKAVTIDPAELYKPAAVVDDDEREIVGGLG